RTNRRRQGGLLSTHQPDRLLRCAKPTAVRSVERASGARERRRRRGSTALQCRPHPQQREARGSGARRSACELSARDLLGLSRCLGWVGVVREDNRTALATGAIGRGAERGVATRDPEIPRGTGQLPASVGCAAQPLSGRARSGTVARAGNWLADPTVSSTRWWVDATKLTELFAQQQSTHWWQGLRELRETEEANGK